MRATHLRTEYLENPIGIDITRPRFYWHCEGGTRQTAYQIRCERGGEIVWDSGKVASTAMTHVRYEGTALGSRDRVEWFVTLWDENDVPGEEVSATFELGLLHPEDWQAKWITGDYSPRKNTRYPVDCFQRAFQVSGTVRKARLYASACGLYQAQLNGDRVGTFELAPGSTDYRKRIQYQTCDVTALLRSGENNLSFELADGWYRGSVGALGLTNAYGRVTKLLYQLEITYEDGGREIIVSDENTRWSNDGPIRFADLKDGEVVDFAMVPGYAGKAKIAEEKVVPTAPDNVIPEMHERFPGKLLKTPSGKTVYDFGQNIAGFIELRAGGRKGQKVLLRMGEMLDEQGEFTQANIQLSVPADEVGKLKEMLVVSGMSEKITRKLKKTPAQQVELTLSGGEDFYRTKFAVFGFRYALVETDAEIADITAVAVYSSMEETGDFHCANADVNQLYQNTLWSMKGNFLDVPTDCPTRERLGWTGDAQVFFNTGAYLMDTAAFFRKFLRDMMDAQTKDGRLPAVVPYSRADVMYNVSGNSVGWADAMVLIPYRYWKRYGDADMLQACWPMMKKYADYLIAHTGHKKSTDAKADPYNKYVYEKGFHLGEWLEPAEFQEKIGTDTAASATKMPRTEECTAYLHYSLSLMAEMAEALCYPEDAKRYQEYADGAVKAYDRLFLTPVPDTDRQAKLVRPLALGVVPPEKKAAVQARLAQAVENRQYRVGTGFLSTPFALSVLTEAGRSDLAYRMLLCQENPSWLYEVKQGATTIWETWEGEVSRNHYSPGAVCEWIFSTMLGIQIAGEREFIIAPVMNPSIPSAEGAYRSLYGEVRVRWNEESCEVMIPVNTTAVISLWGRTEKVGPGTYSFKRDQAGRRKDAAP